MRPAWLRSPHDPVARAPGWLLPPPGGRMDARGVVRRGGGALGRTGRGRVPVGGELGATVRWEQDSVIYETAAAVTSLHVCFNNGRWGAVFQDAPWAVFGDENDQLRIRTRVRGTWSDQLGGWSIWPGHYTSVTLATLGDTPAGDPTLAVSPGGTYLWVVAAVPGTAGVNPVLHAWSWPDWREEALPTTASDGTDLSLETWTDPSVSVDDEGVVVAVWVVNFRSTGLRRAASAVYAAVREPGTGWGAPFQVNEPTFGTTTRYAFPSIDHVRVTRLVSYPGLSPSGFDPSPAGIDPGRPERVEPGAPAEAPPGAVGLTRTSRWCVAYQVEEDGEKDIVAHLAETGSLQDGDFGPGEPLTEDGLSRDPCVYAQQDGERAAFVVGFTRFVEDGPDRGKGEAIVARVWADGWWGGWGGEQTLGEAEYRSDGTLERGSETNFVCLHGPRALGRAGVIGVWEAGPTAGRDPTGLNRGVEGSAVASAEKDGGFWVPLATDPRFGANDPELSGRGGEDQAQYPSVWVSARVRDMGSALPDDALPRVDPLPGTVGHDVAVNLFWVWGESGTGASVRYRGGTLDL